MFTVVDSVSSLSYCTENNGNQQLFGNMLDNTDNCFGTLLSGSYRQFKVDGLTH